jgi:hypothetical protein
MVTLLLSEESAVFEAHRCVRQQRAQSPWKGVWRTLLLSEKPTLFSCDLEHNDITVIHRRHCERSAAIQTMVGQSMGHQNNVAMFCVVSWIAASLTLLAMTIQSNVITL